MNLLTIIALNLSFAVPSITPPEEMSSFDAAALHEPAPVSHKSEQGQVWLATAVAVLDEKLAHGDRRRLGAKVLSPRRVSIIKATSPGANAVVTVNVDLRNKDPEAPQKYISAAFTVDAGGQLSTMLVAPKMRTERVDLLALGDVDGDGAEDFVLAQGPTDATTLHLIAWDATNAVDHVVEPAAEVDVPAGASQAVAER